MRPLDSRARVAGMHDAAGAWGMNWRVASWVAAAVMSVAGAASAWTPEPVGSDPLVRMPGSQPADGLTFLDNSTCNQCHDDFDSAVDFGAHLRGSMMAQATRDPLFWASVAVAAQDSIWAIGRPNASDLCLRCHTPAGWLAGHSDPTNGSALAGDDFDGVTCHFCHRARDPFFESTFAGTREGSDWAGFWDESNASSTPSSAAASATLTADQGETAANTLFDGNSFFDTSYLPPATWLENGGGQFFVAKSSDARGPFADATLGHTSIYSRYHKSRYFCETCHDVSNSVLANLAFASTVPGDGHTVLPTESQPPYSYGHIERTFSEFALSAYAQPGGATGTGFYDPSTFTTMRPGNAIAACEDCHMPMTTGVASVIGGVTRPTGSLEHPRSGIPVHELTGGNAWIPWILASTVTGASNADAENATLLGQGPAALTLSLTAGEGLDVDALLAGVARAEAEVANAASVTNLVYTASTGQLAFRVVNHTGHKLISGFSEGRRMFVNVRLYSGGNLVQEINPYDPGVSTLRGLPLGLSPESPQLLPTQTYSDDLVYEVQQSSSLTGQTQTMHLALATQRYKDNRIPPQGFQIASAAARLAEPVIAGTSSPGYFTAAEYAGGWDDVSLAVQTGADAVEVRLFYQTTSREYVEFLRDEITGSSKSLSSPTPSGEANAYVMSTDPFFAGLVAWGNTVWQLWDHNRSVPGAAPLLMASASQGTVTDPCLAMGSDGQSCSDGDMCSSNDVCTGGFCGGTPTVCTAQDGCHVGTCAPTTGQCSQVAKADGTLCSIGACELGICTPLPAADAGAHDAGSNADSGSAPDATTTADASTDAASHDAEPTDTGAADVATGGGPPADAGPTGAAPPPGCGCRAAPSGASAPWLVGGVLFALIVRRRRDRAGE